MENDRENFFVVKMVEENEDEILIIGKVREKVRDIQVLSLNVYNKNVDIIILI